MKNDLISKAKASLIVDQPFFASILLPMPISEDNSQPTMATDGESIRYNSDWVKGLSLAEIIFVLAHETLHCVFDHMGRRNDRTPNRWNQAADYIINDVLTKERIGVMPKGGLLNSKLCQDGGNTAEGVYKLLPESAEQKGAGQKGGALDHVHDAGSNQGANAVDESTRAQKSAEIRVRVIQAKNAAKMQGKMSAGLERLVNDLVKTRTDWRTILRRFLSERAKVDFSFARPKRRFLAEDFYLPSLSGEKLGKIAIAVDCSGSVDDDLLAIFGAEIRMICEDVAPSEIKVIYFDSDVLGVETFAEGETVTLKPKGGGGTAFSPIFEEIESWSELPIAVVVLTDLCCNDFGNAPSMPVLWASYGLAAAPFGEIIKIEE